MTSENHQVSEVRFNPVESRHQDHLVEFVLIGRQGRGWSTFITEDDLLFVRDRIDEYIKGNFPPKRPFTEKEDA